MSRLIVLSAAVLFCAGCHDPPPCYGLEKGDRFQFTVKGYIVKGYGEQSLDACNDGLDFALDQTAVLTIDGFIGDSGCKSATGQFDPLIGGWTWKQDGKGYTHGGSFFDAWYAASRDQCSAVAEVYVDLDKSTNEQFAVGEVATGRLTRSLASNFQECSQECSSEEGYCNCPGEFTIEVQKLP